MTQSVRHSIPIDSLEVVKMIYLRKKQLKSAISFFIALIIAVIGFIKVKTVLGYLFGVPSLTWLTYLLSNAMCSDLISGETIGCSEKSIYKD